VSVPVKEGPNPLLVIVPGGGWKSSNPGYMGPLIAAFDTWGLTTATLGYGGTESGAAFPVPVEQLACGVRWAAAVATASGRPPTTITVLGHSAGAHLGALVSVSGDAFAGTCPWPSVPIDAFIGLAGLYDPTGAGDIAAAAALPAFFGGSATTDPDAWARGTPATWVTPESAAGLSVFLLHGVEDDALPADQSRQFADVLRAAGADVTMVDWPGGHWDVLDPATVVPPLYTWLVDPARS
jgi:acetyl esterase/lipase